MITPIDIQSKTFKTGMGYSKADVDNFFTTLVSDYETLYRENVELKDKVSILNDGINHYKSIEKSLQKALVLAEQTAEETISSAKANATVIEQEAVLKAQSIVADAKIELDHIRTKTVQILQQYESYRAQYKALAKAQVEVLENDLFNIEIASLDVFTKLDKQATEQSSELNAKTVYSKNSSDNYVKTKIEVLEDDLDETIEGDGDIEINDLESLFESDEVLTKAFDKDEEK